MAKGAARPSVSGHGAHSGLTFAVRLTPRAAEERIDGVKELADGIEVVAARVRAVPEKGAANVALVALLARHFGVAKSAVTIVSGGAARLKRVRIEGEVAGLALILANLKKL